MYELHNILNCRAYQAADQNDLWEILTNEARAFKIFDNTTSVKEIMDTWTLQTGFPVVSVTRNYGNKSVTLKQERFRYSDEQDKETDNVPLWIIPITYTVENELQFQQTKPKYWFNRTSTMLIDMVNITQTNWMIVNVQQTGKFLAYSFYLYILDQ